MMATLQVESGRLRHRYWVDMMGHVALSSPPKGCALDRPWKITAKGLTGYAIWAQEKKLPLGQEALMMLSVESHLLLLRMKMLVLCELQNRRSKHCNFRTEGAGYEMYQAIVYRYRSAYGFSFMERGQWGP
jgi:hypothetical protein